MPCDPKSWMMAQVKILGRLHVGKAIGLRMGIADPFTCAIYPSRVSYSIFLQVFSKQRTASDRARDPVERVVLDQKCNHW